MWRVDPSETGALVKVTKQKLFPVLPGEFSISMLTLIVHYETKKGLGALLLSKDEWGDPALTREGGRKKPLHFVFPAAVEALLLMSQ
ncbi:hypothetical protein J6590_024008 [Homalodisca vitripennis]|nr:hypothetical protein J6590_024008 [Homalodisca vitripennis]